MGGDYGSAGSRPARPAMTAVVPQKRSVKQRSPSGPAQCGTARRTSAASFRSRHRRRRRRPYGPPACNRLRRRGIAPRPGSLGAPPRRTAHGRRRAPDPVAVRVPGNSRCSPPVDDTGGPHVVGLIPKYVPERWSASRFRGGGDRTSTGFVTDPASSSSQPTWSADALDRYRATGRGPPAPPRRRAPSAPPSAKCVSVMTSWFPRTHFMRAQRPCVERSSFAAGVSEIALTDGVGIEGTHRRSRQFMTSGWRLTGLGGIGRAPPRPGHRSARTRPRRSASLAVAIVASSRPAGRSSVVNRAAATRSATPSTSVSIRFPVRGRPHERVVRTARDDVDVTGAMWSGPSSSAESDHRLVEADGHQLGVVHHRHREARQARARRPCVPRGATAPQETSAAGRKP